MRILIIALGSRGDVQPYVVLGAGLRAAGHRVRVATFTAFAPLVERHGLHYHPIPGDPQQLLVLAGGLATDRSFGGVLHTLSGIRRSFGTLAASYADSLLDPALRETDLILNQLPGGLYGTDLAEALQVPQILVAVIPLTPTRTFPLMGFPPLPIPGYNALTYWVGAQLVWQMFRAKIAVFRQQLGLRPPRAVRYFAPFRQMAVPVLNGYSAVIVPRPPDWGSHIHVTGYWRGPSTGWQPPVALERFLDRGAPPIYIGFGSMPVPHSAQLTAQIVAALERTGQRGVLLGGWADLGQQPLPETIYVLDGAPFDWLFPRMAAVIHHGGSGTTGCGVRAGVPAVIVPFGFDQFFWGEQLARIGMAVPPIPVRQLTTERLAAAITIATGNLHIRQRAWEIGTHVATEDGIGAAVRLVERYGSSMSELPMV